MQTDELLRSIRRWLITLVFVLSLLLVLRTWRGPLPEAVAATATLVGSAVALVAALWLWQSFRGGSEGGGRSAEATER